MMMMMMMMTLCQVRCVPASQCGRLVVGEGEVQAVWMVPPSTVNTDTDQVETLTLTIFVCVCSDFTELKLKYTHFTIFTCLYRILLRLQTVHVTLSSVWVGLPGADLKSSEQLTVASVRQHEGVAWSVGAGEAVLPGQEISLTISSTVSQPHFSDIILTYKGEAASRRRGRGQGCAAAGVSAALLHLLLPRLPPPVVNASGGLPWSLEAAEDSEAAVELEAVLSLAEDPATAEQLPDFQQGFASLIAHYGAPLLDGQFEVRLTLLVHAMRKLELEQRRQCECAAPR